MFTKLSKKNVPEGWNETKLSAIGSFSKGAAISKEQLSASGHNAIRYGELYTKHHFHIRKIYSFIPDDVAAQATLIKYGDIIFAGSGETIDEIGKSAAYLMKEDAYAGGDTIIFSPKKADSLFLSYFLNVGEGRKKLRELGQGQSVVHIYKSDIENIKLHLPPLPEQNRIVSVLETWDQAIQKLSRKIDKKKNIKKGLMRELLSGKTRLNGFTKDWFSTTLERVGNIIGGGTPDTTKNEYWGDEIEWFTPTEIKEKYVCSSQRKISNLGLSNSSASLLPEGTLLLTSRATIGDIGIATKRCATNQGFQSIVVNENNSNEFLYYWLLSNRHELIRRSNGSTFSEISGTEVRKIKIRMPDKGEQSAIANILTTADKEIQTLEHKLKILKEQKRYLLNNLITGTIRTPETLLVNPSNSMGLELKQANYSVKKLLN